MSNKLESIFFCPASQSSSSICSELVMPMFLIAITPKTAAIIMVMIIALIVTAVILVLSECTEHPCFRHKSD